MNLEKFIKRIIVSSRDPESEDFNFFSSVKNLHLDLRLIRHGVHPFGADTVDAISLRDVERGRFLEENR